MRPKYQYFNQVLDLFIISRLSYWSSCLSLNCVPKIIYLKLRLSCFWRERKTSRLEVELY